MDLDEVSLDVEAVLVEFMYKCQTAWGLDQATFSLATRLFTITILRV